MIKTTPMKITLSDNLLLTRLAHVMQTAIEVMNPINKAMQNITHAHECFSAENEYEESKHHNNDDKKLSR